MFSSSYSSSSSSSLVRLLVLLCCVSVLVSSPVRVPAVSGASRVRVDEDGVDSIAAGMVSCRVMWYGMVSCRVVWYSMVSCRVVWFDVFLSPLPHTVTTALRFLSYRLCHVLIYVCRHQ
jgi:hypothetical protein